MEGIKTYLRNIVIASLALLLAGCATFGTSEYSARKESTRTLKSLSTSGVGVGQFSPPAEFDNTCRAVGPLMLPMGMTHTQYIKTAVEKELQAAGIYQKNKPRVTLTASIDRLEFSSASGLTAGFWDIEMTLNSSNGGKLTVSEHYEFETGFRARTACGKTGEAFMPAVQGLLHKIFSSPGFKTLVQ